MRVGISGDTEIEICGGVRAVMKLPDPFIRGYIFQCHPGEEWQVNYERRASQEAAELR